MNTIVRKEDGKLYGYNTDCDGALMAIMDGLRDAGVTKLNTSTPPKHIRRFYVLY